MIYSTLCDKNIVPDFMYPLFVLPDDKQRKEIQSFAHSFKSSKRSICKGEMAKIPIKKIPVDNKSLQKHCEPPKKQVCHV